MQRPVPQVRRSLCVAHGRADGCAIMLNALFGLAFCVHTYDRPILENSLLLVKKSISINCLPQVSVDSNVVPDLLRSTNNRHLATNYREESEVRAYADT